MPTKVSGDDPSSQIKANMGSVPDEDLTTPANTRIVTFDNTTGLQSAYWSQTELSTTETPSVENKSKRKRFRYKPQDNIPLSSSKRKCLRKSSPLVQNSVGTPRTTNSAKRICPPNNGHSDLQALLADHHVAFTMELEFYPRDLGLNILLRANAQCTTLVITKEITLQHQTPTTAHRPTVLLSCPILRLCQITPH